MLQRVDVVANLQYVIAGPSCARLGVEDLREGSLRALDPRARQGLLGEIRRDEQVRIREDPTGAGEPTECGVGFGQQSYRGEVEVQGSWQWGRNERNIGMAAAGGHGAPPEGC
jgi:hypothetical protein